MGTDTEVVRREAHCWSLASDQHLLNMLKTMHEKVVTRATQVDSKVQEMLAGVRCAGVALENVNNRLSSLNSNQFIESRVYDDDDDDLTTTNQTQEQQPTVQKCESSPSEGLLVLHRFYEELEILPDSSDSDEDEEHHSSVVLRAKDLYADRPLPAVIGSATWKTKWHAGLLEEDSDSDSSVCKRDSHVEQYSSSDDGGHLQESLPINRDHQESFTSEDIPVSDEDSSSKAGEQAEPGVPSQSEFAAELARRLGGHATVQPAPTVASTAGHTARTGLAARHMFTDQLDRHRVTGNLFPDEPPPLDAASDDDMFDTHRPPHKHYDDDDDDDDIFDDFADSKVGEAAARKLHDDHMSDATKDSVTASTVKKPVGGKSLFGSQKGADIIGAAIQRRRESSSSDDELRPPQDSAAQKTLRGDRTIVHDVNPDIFDDLFAKSEQENKKLELKDDMFDDIDDIFSTEIVTKAPIKEVTISRNIFDDHDDLFADIDVNFDFKTQKPNQGKLNVGHVSTKRAPDSTTSTTKDVKSEEFKNIFGDDDDDDDNGLFHSITKTEIGTDKTKAKSLFGGSDEDLFKDDKDDTNYNTKVKNNVVESQQIMQNEINKQSNVTINIINKNKSETKANIFEDNKSDDIFIKSNKSNELEQQLVDNDTKRRENFEENVNPEKTHDISFNEDRNIEKEYFDNAAIPEPDHLKYEYKNIVAIDREEKNIFSQDSTQEHLHSNKEDVDDKVDNNLHRNNLNEIQNEFSESEKNIDELFRNSGENDSVPSFINNDFHDIFKDHPPVVEKTEKTEHTTRSSNINENMSSTVNNDFHDILFNDQPPAFEKSKDIKKSKNINALFDDDSDDESLFFKKNDTLEEKPDVFLSKNDSGRIFGLFSDEPPAAVSDDDDLFSNKPVIEQKSGEDSFEFAAEKERPPLSVPVKVQNIAHDPKENVNVLASAGNVTEDPDGKDVLTETDTRKPVGKIKSNLNINVSTLLPGASPKKIVKSSELKKDDNERVDLEKSELDGGVLNEPIDIDIDIPKIKEYPEMLVKSASFDGNPESPVLCNTFSKERAKIQVRRRPSTRRARREAIKKSDTDTDLAKIVDDTDAPEPSNITTLGKVYTHTQTTRDDIAQPLLLPKHKSDKHKTENTPQTVNEELNIRKEVAVTLLNNPDKRQLIIEESDDDDIFKTFTRKSVQVEDKKPRVEQTPTTRAQATPRDTTTQKQTKQKSLFGDESSDDELFGGSNTSNTDGDKRGGALASAQTQKTQTKSLFGDDGDEDLFASRATANEHSRPTKRQDKSVLVALN